VGCRRAALILRKGFWEEEGGGGNPADSAPLLRRNAAFIYDPLSAEGGGRGGEALEVCHIAKQRNAALLRRVGMWVGMCGGAGGWLGAGGRAAPVMKPLPGSISQKSSDSVSLLRRDFIVIVYRETVAW